MRTLFRLLFTAFFTTSVAAWAQLSDTTIVLNRTLVAPTAANDWTDILVTCPAGLVALSGGVDTNGFDSLEVTTLAPTFNGAPLAFEPDGLRGPADGWYASVKNLATTAQPVAVSAICVSISSVIVNVASAAVTAGTQSQAGDGTAFAACPAGYSGVGGGVDVSLPASMKVSASAPLINSQFLIDRPAGAAGAPNGWSASVRSEGGSGVLKVAAVCAQISGVTTVSTGPFNVGVGAVAGLSAQCPARSLLLGGGIDSANVSRNVVAVSTPMFGLNPQFPADLPTGAYGAAAGWYGVYFNYGPGTTTGAVAAICAAPSPDIVIVYEFFNTALRHYFRTANAAEAAAIDRGAAGPGWVRTGDNFYAYAASSNNPGADVCRFYTFGANSHFYTAFPAECASLKSPSSGWMYEGLAFRIPLPSGSSCAAGTIPVYRLYNNRFQFNDSNHRFTTAVSDIPILQAQGWTLEGVAFCALSLP